MEPNEIDAIWTPQGLRYHAIASGLNIYVTSTLVTDLILKPSRWASDYMRLCNNIA